MTTFLPAILVLALLVFLTSATKSKFFSVVFTGIVLLGVAVFLGIIR